tara:strand:- start:444 stop:1898 length:1455 start_codon:yes stop_codon:yes gene_type:complete
MSLFNFYHILPSTVFDFPVIDSGGPLLSKIYQVAEATQAPLPMVVQGGLATASFLLQNLVDVEKPNGQVVPPSQYFVTVAVSGERKTTVDNQFSQDLNELEADLDDNYEQEVLEYELDFEIWKAKKRGLLKAVVNDGDENAITQLYEHEQAQPKHPARAGIRTFSDVTPEAALDIFYRESINSAILRSSEGEEILAGPAARKLSLWNSLWGGDPVRVDRKTSSSFVVNPRTTLFIQAQPSIMQRFVAKGGENARGIGFFARTHITYPLTTQGYRQVKEIDKTPNTEYEKWVKELFEFNVQASKAADFKRIKIGFSLLAKERWFIVANEIEREIRVGGRFERDGDHASKLADNIARMSVLLHCAEHGLNEEVSLDTLNDAIRLSFWFSNEFIRLFQAPSEEQQDYFSLQGWFNQKRTEGYRYLRKNRVRKYGPNSLRDAGKLNITLDALHNNGEIRIGTMAKKTIIDLYPNYQDDQALLMSVVNS